MISSLVSFLFLRHPIEELHERSNRNHACFNDCDETRFAKELVGSNRALVLACDVPVERNHRDHLRQNM